MGMFDNVLCEYPLPDEAAKLVSEWQTKTFDAPGLELYRITPEGRLMEEVYHTEDRSDKNAAPGTLASIRGIWTKVHEGWRDLNFHGVLNFYGHTGDWQKGHGDWIEYDAYFTDGHLTRIERVPDRYKSTLLSVREAPSNG